MNKRSFWFGGGFILLLLAGVLLINSIVGPVIRWKIQAAASKGGCQLSYGQLSFNVLTGNVDLSSIKLHEEFLQANVKTIRVSDVKVLGFWRHKKLEVGELLIDGASISLKSQQRNSDQSSQTLYQKLSGSLKLLSMAHIDISDARLDYVDLRVYPAL